MSTVEAKHEAKPAPLARQAVWEIEAAKEIVAQLADLTRDDPEFCRDLVEGETNLHEIIGKLVEEDNADDGMVDGIEQAEKRLSERRDRIKKRMGVRRALILQGLQVAGLKKLETPAGTVSVRPVPVSVIITEEADIPAQFWKQPAPTLDKRALLVAAKEEAVPGVTLSNGGETVSVRR